jgi:hypothetical protein
MDNLETVAIVDTKDHLGFTSIVFGGVRAARFFSYLFFGCLCDCVRSVSFVPTIATVSRLSLRSVSFVSTIATVSRLSILYCLSAFSNVYSFKKKLITITQTTKKQITKKTSSTDPAKNNGGES